MWINSAISGHQKRLDADAFEALECAGLLMVTPTGIPVRGWVLHNVTAALSGMPASSWTDQHECTNPNSADHHVAHEFVNLIEERIVSPYQFQVVNPELEVFSFEDDSDRKLLRSEVNSFVETWQQLIATSMPSRGAMLLRKPLPFRIRDEQTTIQIQQSVEGNRQRSDKSRQAAELVRTVRKLTMLDHGSPENGPVMWTIAFALLEKPSGSSMRLTELVQKVATYLGKSKNGYVAQIAQESIFRKVSSGDDIPVIELDFSGRGEAGPFSLNSNLSCSPGLYRLENSWLYDVSDFAKSNGEIPIPLPLAVHLAILARSIGEEWLESTIPAVVVMGERRGWMYLRPESLAMPHAQRRTCVQISDDGSISVRAVANLQEVIPNFPELSLRPIEMLKALGGLLGMRVMEDSSTFPLPGVVRAWVKARGPNPTSFDQQILTLAFSAQRQLEEDSNVLK